MGWRLNLAAVHTCPLLRFSTAPNSLTASMALIFSNSLRGTGIPEGLGDYGINVFYYLEPPRDLRDLSGADVDFFEANNLWERVLRVAHAV